MSFDRGISSIIPDLRNLEIYPSVTLKFLINPQGMGVLDLHGKVKDEINHGAAVGVLAEKQVLDRLTGNGLPRVPQHMIAFVQPSL